MGSESIESEPIRAAGVVVLRDRDGHTEVLLVHRPAYLDWSLPKGKCKATEHPAVTAVRECDEETGLQVSLGLPLDSVNYLVGDREKTVQYWRATPTASDANRDAVGDGDEVDEVAWVEIGQAQGMLRHDTELRVLAQACRLPQTIPLIVLRHARAMKRVDYRGKQDAQRPLTGRGRSQSKDLVGLLDAYGITSVVSSDAERCLQTVRRYAKSIDAGVLRDHAFSEEGHTSRVERTLRHAHRLAMGAEPTVVCTHRPVLPTMLEAIAEALGADPADPQWDPRLRPGGCLVIHRAMQSDGRLVVAAAERHEPFPE